MLYSEVFDKLELTFMLGRPPGTIIHAFSSMES